ncbi:hypothetical protein NQ318_000027 [Aromia moschata]|uniref:ZAD domain-containing protein n=1 Tax=Aromia moschata TaxID=1265417 RepID=A0AAV8YBE9_9CUCU|nr:hypothetical protein NQ318_000027 [Aromia moschata]
MDRESKEVLAQVLTKYQFQFQVDKTFQDAAEDTRKTPTCAIQGLANPTGCASYVLGPFGILKNKRQEIQRKVFSHNFKEIIQILMLKLDLRITPEPVMCYGCAETLKTAFDFKSACIYTEDCLYPFIEGTSETRLDLREIYLKVNDNEDVESVNGCEVCRFCMKLSDSGRCTPVEVIEENVDVKKLLEYYVPEVVMGAFEKPVACENCLSFLRQYSLFVTRFSNIEQQIQSYAKTLGRDCVGEIDLRQMRDFSLSNVTKLEVETIANDKGAKEEVMIFSQIESEEQITPEEKIECEKKEISESKISMASPESGRREQEEFDGFAGNEELLRRTRCRLLKRHMKTLT